MNQHVPNRNVFPLHLYMRKDVQRRYRTYQLAPVWSPRSPVLVSHTAHRETSRPTPASARAAVRTSIVESQVSSSILLSNNRFIAVSCDVLRFTCNRSIFKSAMSAARRNNLDTGNNSEKGSVPPR